MKNLLIFLALASSTSAFGQQYTCDQVDEEFEKQGLVRPELGNNTALAVAYDYCESVRQLACTDSARVAIDSLIGYVGRYSKDAEAGIPLVIDSNESHKEFDLNFDRNLRALLGHQAKVRQRIQALVNDQSNPGIVIDSISALKSKKSEVNTKIKELNKDIQDLYQRSGKFLRFSKTAERKIAHYLGTIQAIKEHRGCLGIKPTIDLMETDARALIEDIGLGVNYIKVMRYKFRILRDMIQPAMGALYIKRYADHVGQDLATLKAEIEKTLRLDDLGWEIGEWWVSSSSGGLNKGLHTTYLQFERPLRLFNHHLGTAKSFRETVIQRAASQTGFKDTWVSFLDNKIQALELNISALEQAGWQGQRDRQKLFISFFETQPGLNGDCRDHLSKYRELGPISDLGSFRKAEDLFSKVMRGCQ